MNDEPRLRLDDLRDADAPGQADRDRVHARLTAALATGAGAGVVSLMAAKSAKLSLWAWLAPLSLALAVAGGAILWWPSAPLAPALASATRTPPPAARLVAAPDLADIEIEPGEPLALVRLQVTPFVLTPPVRRARPRVAEGPIVLSRVPSPELERVRPLPSADDLAAETRLLRQAQTALGAGDVAAARKSLAAYRARFHALGALSPEADALQVKLACTSGDLELARSLAQRFIIDHQGSPLAKQVARICQ
jgi:hypothetical protein